MDPTPVEDITQQQSEVTMPRNPTQTEIPSPSLCYFFPYPHPHIGRRARARIHGI